MMEHHNSRSRLGFSFKFTNSFRLLRINCPEVEAESREEGLKKAETD
jgi:hypothetical protein